MGKLHVKGWGRKTNYLNGKVACQGLGVGVGKKCTQNQSGKKVCQKRPAKVCQRWPFSTTDKLMEKANKNLKKFTMKFITEQYQKIKKDQKNLGHQ